MDTLSHALWGRGLFGYRGYKWLAIFFGTIKDYENPNIQLNFGPAGKA